jgi:hypothetical protein
VQLFTLGLLDLKAPQSLYMHIYLWRVFVTQHRSTARPRFGGGARIVKREREMRIKRGSAYSIPSLSLSSYIPTIDHWVTRATGAATAHTLLFLLFIPHRTSYAISCARNPRALNCLDYMRSECALRLIGNPPGIMQTLAWIFVCVADNQTDANHAFLLIRQRSNSMCYILRGH